jgi:hypothetical protein
MPDDAGASGPQATWAVDPTEPGPSLPRVGRSLFDFLITEDVNGKKIYRVPFPFQALTDKIAAQLEPAEPGTSPLKPVLIPLGRSLQRAAAAPEFFKYPRVIVATDAEPKLQSGRAGLLLKDRLYLAYQEKAGIIEVISYNEGAGRFEFEIVKDYRAGGDARVFYANRFICTACHQNGAPIFSRPLWDETNANPRIAALLRRARPHFYGIQVDRGVDIPNAIADAAERANLIAPYQLLWRQACARSGDAASAIRCRADAFLLMLQYRLSGERRLNSASSMYRNEFAPAFAKEWQRRWPGGLAVPDPDIPNRDPLQLLASSALDGLAVNAGVPARFDPLNPRAPLENWSGSAPGAIERVLRGLSDAIAEVDVRRLDDHLYAAGLQSGAPRERYRSTCELTQKREARAVYRLSLQCSDHGGPGTFAMAGRLYVRARKVERGLIDTLTIQGAAAIRDVSVVAGTIERQNRHTVVSLRVARTRLHARAADGKAIEGIELRWSNAPPADGAPATFSGAAAVTVMDDFMPVQAAVAEMARLTAAGRLDVFADKPFRRVETMRALFAQLRMPALAWCCTDDTGLPAAAVDVDRKVTATVGNRGFDIAGVRPFYRFCGKCHYTREHAPPNFLYGDANEVSANLARCAQRLYFRLSMWQLPPEQRPKTPMPPVLAVSASKLSPAQWRDSAELAQLRGYLVTMLRSSVPGVRTEPAQILARDYETLPSCLPPVH